MDSMFNTPQEVVQANMNGAVKKATTSKKKVFFMGIMAGVCIALGAQSSNVAMHDIANVGLARLVAVLLLWHIWYICPDNIIIPAALLGHLRSKLLLERSAYLSFLL